MNDQYPLSNTIILTDAIFIANGGSTGTSTAAQRNAAYFISEEAVSRDIPTLLLPVVVTGTYTWEEYTKYITTEWAYVSEVILTRFLDIEESVYYTVSGTANVYVSLRDSERGQIDIHSVFANCRCASGFNPFPYHIQLVYRAGLPTGTANRPNVLLALSTYADEVLQEIIGWGNETPGIVGVQSFKNQDYSEIRTKLSKTAFGSSPRAQFVKNLLVGLRRRRYVKLGW
jgi:hypothetical protein